jgi:hypothetical protein
MYSSFYMLRCRQNYAPSSSWCLVIAWRLQQFPNAFLGRPTLGRCLDVGTIPGHSMLLLYQPQLILLGYTPLADLAGKISSSNSILDHFGSSPNFHWSNHSLSLWAEKSIPKSFKIGGNQIMSIYFGQTLVKETARQNTQNRPPKNISLGGGLLA